MVKEKERILGKIDEVEGYLRKIEEYLPSDFKGYEKDEMRQRALERLLHISIESIIDMAALVVKDLRLGVPSDEEDLFDKLRDNGTIDKGLAERMKEMKRFRNFLVHRYSHIDSLRIFKFLNEDVEDLKEFSDSIRNYIGTS